MWFWRLLRPSPPTRGRAEIAAAKAARREQYRYRIVPADGRYRGPACSPLHALGIPPVLIVRSLPGNEPALAKEDDGSSQ